MGLFSTSVPLVTSHRNLEIVNKPFQYKRPLLITDFLFVNLPIHMEKLVKNDNFQSKMDFLSANSRFAVQNDGTYLPQITSESCTL